MTNLLVLIRNLVLATILAWLGIEFAPDGADKDEQSSARGVVAALVG